MRFTPGPWIVEDRELQGCDILAPVKDWSNKPVRIANAVPFANALATANLMAAAPEMYEALTKAESYLNHGEGQEPSGLRLISAIELIRAAIAKAEGKQP